MNDWLKRFGVVLLPAGLLLAYWNTRPFSAVRVDRHFSISSLSAAQRVNLMTAARTMDGAVIRPGAKFSFNRVVGPRTLERGYREAPSYLDGDSPKTVGGGICLLSSALYQVALAGGLSVQDRVPHLRTVHSVPPGLDASVWYGRADLSFENTTQDPVRIQTNVKDGVLEVRLLGRRSGTPVTLRSRTRTTPDGRLQAEVFAGSSLVSRDLYRVSP